MRLEKVQIGHNSLVFTLVLSRRNLLTLLAKLDGYPEDSSCAILGGIDAPGVRVQAEEDDEHYHSDKRHPKARGMAGSMHPATENRIAADPFHCAACGKPFGTGLSGVSFDGFVYRHMRCS